MNQVRPRRGDPLPPPSFWGRRRGPKRDIRALRGRPPPALFGDAAVGRFPAGGGPAGRGGLGGGFGEGVRDGSQRREILRGGPSRAALPRPADVSPHSPSLVAAQGLTPPPLLLRDRQWLNHELMSGEGPGGGRGDTAATAPSPHCCRARRGLNSSGQVPAQMFLGCVPGRGNGPSKASAVLFLRGKQQKENCTACDGRAGGSGVGPTAGRVPAGWGSRDGVGMGGGWWLRPPPLGPCRAC